MPASRRRPVLLRGRLRAEPVCRRRGVLFPADDVHRRPLPETSCVHGIFPLRLILTPGTGKTNTVLSYGVSARPRTCTMSIVLLGGYLVRHHSVMLSIYMTTAAAAGADVEPFFVDAGVTVHTPRKLPGMYAIMTTSHNSPSTAYTSIVMLRLDTVRRTP